MTSENDEPGHEEGDLPLYKYRYKYLHKYGDAPPDEDARAAQDSDDADKGNDGDEGKDEGGEKGEGKDNGKDGPGKDKKETQDDEKKKSPEEERKQKRKRFIVMGIIALVFVLAGLAWLLYDVLVLSQRETTDDAYVKGDMVTISPRVAGTVTEVAVEETERVHAGQVLLRLDPVDASVSLMNAEGELAQAVRQAQQGNAQAAQADAAIVQAEAQYRVAKDNYERRHPLLGTRAVSQEEVDSERRQMQGAMASLKQAQAQARAAHAQVDGTDVHNFPAVVRARAQFRNAWVNSSRNAIVSPIDGYAARRQVQVGQRVQPGQDLITVVPLLDLWVDANFKETQLQNIRIGQPVEITTDMYSKVKYHGHVVGLTAGTGSAFSLLPAENATGNWIKVVQRLPVRIAIDEDSLKRFPLRIGLSTYIKVDTHDRDGKVLAESPRSKPLATTEVYAQEMTRADERAEEIIRDNTVSTQPITSTKTRGRDDTPDVRTTGH
ncbi:efflux RND transporter periplasmic adaptor subunit [Pinirhizobacter sp.]|jgi:membrane fusion protein (multidrug efflux system)|uniref:efflux RND transporter periplasmic adaptor subunit n=1 Tax=Pinirhizobacter sp. TaxID=2950432 RepID=UPI002F41F361